jgi:hypothetical protein
MLEIVVRTIMRFLLLLAKTIFYLKFQLRLLYLAKRPRHFPHD